MENKKMEELLCDKSFLKKLVEAKTVDEVKSIFKEEGQEITDEQFKELKEFFSQMAKVVKVNSAVSASKKIHDKNKLDDSSLENVSGGSGGGEKAAIAAAVAAGAAAAGGLFGFSVATLAEEFNRAAEECRGIEISEAQRNAKKEESHKIVAIMTAFTAVGAGALATGGVLFS